MSTIRHFPSSPVLPHLHKIKNFLLGREALPGLREASDGNVAQADDNGKESVQILLFLAAGKELESVSGYKHNQNLIVIR